MLDNYRDERPLVPWLHCPHRHEMEEVSKVKDEELKEGDRVDCSHCLQPNIGIHMKHYECSNRDCDI